MGVLLFKRDARKEDQAQENLLVCLFSSSQKEFLLRWGWVVLDRAVSYLLCRLGLYWSGRWYIIKIFTHPRMDGGALSRFIHPSEPERFECRWPCGPQKLWLSPWPLVRLQGQPWLAASHSARSGRSSLAARVIRWR